VKSQAWYVHFPNDAYALGPFRFDEPVTEREARAYVRAWEGVKRLPRGTEFWPER
jgi:hypothetical protein